MPLPESTIHQRPGVTFAALDREAYANTDLQVARDLQEAREARFVELRSPA